MAKKKKGQGSRARQASREQQASPSGIALFAPGNIRQFVQQVQAEFKKVVWPDRKVTLGLTGFVIILVVILSLYLGSVDLLLGKLVSLVLQ
jgi:preprotein translocase subunit SecE